MSRRSRKKQQFFQTSKTPDQRECRAPGLSRQETTAAVLMACALAAATLVLYLQTLRYRFVNVDDVEYILQNRAVRAGVTADGIRWAFTSFYAANWHPITWLSHMLDVQFFGLWPGGHHLTNVLLHTANSLLLMLFLLLATRSAGKSAFAAGLFALHPQHVESVAWVAERKDVLSAFFMMLALLAYLRYTRSPSFGRYLLTAAAFALGLMSKPMLVTLPALLLLADFCPLKRYRTAGEPTGYTRSPVSLLLEKVPLLAMSAGSAVLTVKAQAAVGALSTLEKIPLGERAANAVMSYVIYLGKTFWPTRLGQFYPRPAEGWPVAQTAAAAVALAAVTYFCIRTAKSRPYAAWGWLWYLTSLAPVIGIIQVGNQARADRYTYIPLIGIFVIAAFAGSELLHRVRISRIGPAAALLVLGALGSVSYVQAGYWRDAVTLNRRAISVTENNWYSLGSLGSWLQDEADRLYDEGKTQEAVRRANEAAELLDKCLAIAPGCARARDAKARGLAIRGDLDRALTELEQAAIDDPRDAVIQDHLGMAYRLKGRLLEAAEAFRKAVELNPRYVEAHGNLAITYYDLGDYAGAWEHVALCEQHGGRAPQAFLQKLSEKMPDPRR